MGKRPFNGMAGTRQGGMTGTALNGNGAVLKELSTDIGVVPVRLSRKQFEGIYKQQQKKHNERDEVVQALSKNRDTIMKSIPQTIEHVTVDGIDINLVDFMLRTSQLVRGSIWWQLYYNYYADEESGMAQTAMDIMQKCDYDVVWANGGPEVRHKLLWVGSDNERTGVGSVFPGFKQDAGWREWLQDCLLGVATSYGISVGFEATYYANNTNSFELMGALLIAAAYGFINNDTGKFQAERGEGTPQENVDALLARWDAERGNHSVLMTAIDALQGEELLRCGGEDNIDWPTSQVAKCRMKYWRGKLKLLRSESEAALEKYYTFNPFMRPCYDGEYKRITNPYAELIHQSYGDEWDKYIKLNCDSQLALGTRTLGCWEEGTHEYPMADIMVAGLCMALRIKMPDDLKDKVCKAQAKRAVTVSKDLLVHVDMRLKMYSEAAEKTAEAAGKAIESEKKHRDRADELRNKLRTSEKEKKQLEESLERVRKKLARQHSMLQEAGMDPDKPQEVKTDYDRIIRGLRQKVESLQENLRVADKERARLTDELGATRESLNSAGKELAKMRSLAEQQSDNLHMARMQQRTGRIPIGVYANALKNVKIAVVGGWKCFDGLKQSGLDVVCFGNAERDNPKVDVGVKDVLVIMTKFVGHALQDQAMKSASKYGTPILRCDGHTAEEVILDVFHWVYTPSANRSNSLLSQRAAIV